MKQKILIFTLLLSFGNHPLVYAKDVPPSQEANGCGTAGIQGILVPDSTYFTKCKFHDACVKHDHCYGRCLEGGDLYGKDTCEDPIAKEKRRKKCDEALYNNIASDNNDRMICESYGLGYKLAVMKFGKGNFNGREIEIVVEEAFKKSKGKLEEEKLYKELQTIQQSTISPQTLPVDIKKDTSVLKQKKLEPRLNPSKIKEITNKTNTFGQ